MSDYKQSIKYFVFSILFFSVITITLSLGVWDNPNFSIHDFFLNLASELVGLFITVLIVDTYLRMKRQNLQDYWERREKKIRPSERPKVEAESGDFVVTAGDSLVKSVTTLRDKATGIEYLLVIHEQGSSLTPLLNTDGQPVVRSEQETK